jgi:hypothetical protein
VDIDDAFGVTLTTCSIEEIKQAITKVADLSTPGLLGMARQAWEFARANHTRELFANAYQKIVEQIITVHGKV